MNTPRLIAPFILASSMLLASIAQGDTGRARNPPSLAGKLLVANPSMSDPRFAGTVIVMARHGPKGALGFVVNRIHGRRPISKIIGSLGMSRPGVKGELDIHWGGPVGADSAVVVHSRDYRIAGTQMIGGGLAMTGSPKVLADIGLGRGPKRALFVRGYSGWGPGQLEREIKRKDWIVIAGDRDLIFRRFHSDTWKRAFARRGVDL